MSKVKAKKHAGGGGRATKRKHNNTKKSFFYKNQEKKQKAKSVVLLAPPSHAQDYSCNWKSLLQALPASSEKKNEGSKQMKNTNVKEKQTASSSKDSKKHHKHFKKATQRLEKDQKMQNGMKQSGHKHFKAQKRKIKDGEERADDKKNKPEEENKTAEPDFWFDDVDADDIESTLGSEAADIFRKQTGKTKCDPKNTDKVLVKENAFAGLTRAVAMDCEMVGVGSNGEDSILARVSIVNHFGKCIYDKYVKPTEKVTDYRTHVSGIRPADIANGEDIKTVQMEVAQILDGRILVGHAIHNDLKILLLAHPKRMIRDTQKYKPFRKRVKSSRPALRNLCKEILNVQVQQGEHSSVQDAQATMRLYTMVKKEWEAELKDRRTGPFQQKTRKPRPSKNQDKIMQIIQ